MRRGILLAGLCFVAACAENECSFNSQCGPSMYCRLGGCFQNCELDLDCDPGEMCSAIGQCEPAVDGGRFDAGARDSSVDSGRDAAMDGGRDAATADSALPDAGTDAGTDAGNDAGNDAGVDAGPLGQRLDPCTTGSECESLVCDGSRCTVRCMNNAECADDEFCGAGVCQRDDTGAMCSIASADTCGLDLCIGDAGSGECTRPCSSAGECPSGFACSLIGGMQLCMAIEVPCDDGTDCRSGLCLTVQGCTATCRSAADCPARATGLGVPAYTCERAFGSMERICVPPADILGMDPIGASCAASGPNTCRSGLCNPGALGGPVCTQTCTAEGGCGPGFGCKPEELDGGIIELLCARAGSLPVGATCARAADCETALCNAPGYCTRLCNDSLCPTGFRCDPLPRTTSRMCIRI